MRFLVDGRTRPLSNADQPNQALPYDDLTLQHDWTGGTILDDTTVTHTFTDTDWGADLDFYISSFLFWVSSSGDHDFFGDNDDLIDIYLANPAATYEYFFVWTFTGARNTAGKLNGNRRFARSFLFPQLRRVLVTESIEISLANYTGGALSASFFINGIPK